MKSVENINQLFPKGDKAPSEYFVGEAWIKVLVSPNDGAFDCVVNDVAFAPGARTNWHTHPGGQILICTDGIGYYQEKGNPIRLLNKGDVVKILPELKHWHGASPESWFTHMAINPSSAKGGVKWMEKVTDEQYNNLLSDAE
jgi:quercetin dioxygenase-like cupin family protein